MRDLFEDHPKKPETRSPLKIVSVLLLKALSIVGLFLKKLKKHELIDRKNYFNILLLIFIVLMPWISEATINKQIYTELKRYSEPLDPIKAGELAERFNQYTPGIKENAEDVALNLLVEKDSYTLAQQLSLNANKKIDAPSRQDATYTVGEGETITQIAEKFSLHVATILDANNLKPEEANKIKPQTVLKIPSSDTSTSTDWLVAIKEAEEQEKAAYEKKLAEERNRRLALSARTYASSYQTSYQGGYQGSNTGSLITPISSRGISQYFGRGHTGIDYMANAGTPVMAASGGRVVIISSGWSGGYGNQVVIDHGSGRATRYAHLSSINVGTGQYVSQGQVIAHSGNTGRSSGPHLHFELIINGRPVPPF